VRSLVGTRARRINLRPQLVEDGSQGPNAIADGVLGSTDELDRLDGQDGLFLFDSSGFFICDKWVSASGLARLLLADYSRVPEADLAIRRGGPAWGEENAHTVTCWAHAYRGRKATRLQHIGNLHQCGGENFANNGCRLRQRPGAASSRLYGGAEGAQTRTVIGQD